MDLIDNYVPEFSNILLGKKSMISNNYSCILSETNINITANPMICTLIAFYLKNNISVFFVSSQESFIHYSSICKKMSFNLTNNDNFYFYDAFYSPYKSIIKEELPLSENIPYTFGTSRCKNYIESTGLDKGTFNFNDITENIKKIEFKTQRKVLIFDNLSILPYNKETIIDEINKIMKCCIDYNLDLIINKNNELISKDLAIYLAYLADIEISFLANLAGYSKDIDGQVCVSINNVNQDKEYHLRYKVKENSINFFLHFII